MAKGFNGISVGRSIGMLFFWVTPATCVSSIFLFAFGVSMLSYFLTGNESVTVWEVLKLMESLPDPREFLSDCFKIYNKMQEWSNAIQIFNNGKLQTSNDLLKQIFNGFNTLIGLTFTVTGFVITMIVSLVAFPIYCVFFTLRTVGGFLTFIGVGNITSYTSMSWKLLGWLGL